MSPTSHSFVQPGQTAADPARAAPPEGTKDRLGALIDQAGRQRMLSHRAVMFLSLAREGSANGFDAQARAAVEAFEAIARSFLGRSGADGLAADWLARLIETRAPDYRPATGRFLRDVAEILAATENVHPRDLSRLAGFVAGPLLAALNGVVDMLKAELAALNETERAEAQEAGVTAARLLAEIEEIGVRVRMISINALIQATRAGEAGGGFAVIANEIKELAGRMQAAVRRITRDLRTSLADGA